MFELLGDLISELFDGGDLPDTGGGAADLGGATDHSGSSGEVRFGEGRWEGGTDHNGYPVAQSSTGPPYYTGGPDAGQPANPNDVSWP